MKYLFTLSEPLIIGVQLLPPNDYVSKATLPGTKTPLLEIWRHPPPVEHSDGRFPAYLRMPSPYAWDGCSPKFKMFGRIFGTPDGPCRNTNWQASGKPVTWRASCGHDDVYQNVEDIAAAWRISVRDVMWYADQWFYQTMILDGTEEGRATLYYRAVRAAGYPYHQLAKVLPL